MEHVRHASTLERLAAQDWESVLHDVVAGTKAIEEAAERREEGEGADDQGEAEPEQPADPDPVVLALPETTFVDAAPATPARREPPVVYAFPFSSPPSMDAPSEGARVDKPAGPTASEGTPAEVPHQEGCTTSLPRTTLPSSSSAMPAVPEVEEPHREGWREQLVL